MLPGGADRISTDFAAACCQANNQILSDRARFRDPVTFLNGRERLAPHSLTLEDQTCSARNFGAKL